MLCNSCKKLALFSKQHKCVNCPRLCVYKEEKWCKYCSTVKGICSVCGKPVKLIKGIRATEEPNSTQPRTQIQKTHPFFGGGCRSCGGNR